MRLTACVPLIILFFNSCKDNIVSNGSPVIFYPIAHNNYWKYTSPIISNKSDTLIEHIGDENSDLGGMYYYSWRVNNGIGINYCLLSDSGLLMKYQNSEHVFLLYKYPGKKDEIYLSGENNQDTIKIVAIDEQVSTYLGKYYCVVYQIIYWQDDPLVGKKPLYFNRYIAPGIGKVKQESYYLDKEKNKKELYELLLFDYSLSEK